MGDTYDSAAEAGADQRPVRCQQSTHRITVEVIGHRSRGPIYCVTYAGQVLLAGCRCPLLEACRALLAKGITGRLEQCRPGNDSWDAAVDIEAGAAWMVIENEDRGPTFGGWTPPTLDAFSRVRHRARTGSDRLATLLPTQEPEPALAAAPAE
jgi:hypothetical protein